MLIGNLLTSVHQWKFAEGSVGGLALNLLGGHIFSVGNSY